MQKQQFPFRFMRLSPSVNSPFHSGHIISTMDECGIFVCTNGEVKLSLEGEIYLIRRGDMYIYMPSSPLRLLSKSKDSEGLLAAFEVDYMLPVVQRVMNTENMLYIRKHPFFSPTEEEYKYIWSLQENLQNRMEMEQRTGNQQQRLMMELIKSMAQTLTYEVLGIYFSHLPIQPLPQSKKDIIFQNFMLSLPRHFRREREVSFYAGLQHLTPRYFSTIIKEKSGSNALQWIVQMVISDAKQQLENFDLSIKEIAMRLNFPTQSFFGKYFKQYTGMSPKEYRERVRKY